MDTVLARSRDILHFALRTISRTCPGTLNRANHPRPFVAGCHMKISERNTGPPPAGRIRIGFGGGTILRHREHHIVHVAVNRHNPKCILNVSKASTISPFQFVCSVVHVHVPEASAEVGPEACEVTARSWGCQRVQLCAAHFQPTTAVS